MKSVLRSISLLIALPILALSACAENDKKIHDKIISNYNFNYQIPQKQIINLSQVFDNKKDTIFAFNVEPKFYPVVSDTKKEVVIPLKHEGNYWIMHNCVMPELKVSLNNTFIIVKNTGFIPKPIPTDAKLAKHYKPEYSYCGYVLKHHKKTINPEPRKIETSEKK
ncbi:MAG: hypothetical protein WCJ33_00065 [Pseudomonadota bacterium]